MKWFVYKQPRKKEDFPIETFMYEPPQIIIEQRAVKYGPIVVLSEEYVLKEKKV